MSTHLFILYVQKRVDRSILFEIDKNKKFYIKIGCLLPSGVIPNLNEEAYRTFKRQTI
jgi:hypothetical protein